VKRTGLCTLTGTGEVGGAGSQDIRQFGFCREAELVINWGRYMFKSSKIVQQGRPFIFKHFYWSLQAQYL
jgi:hypothetical protein